MLNVLFAVLNIEHQISNVICVMKSSGQFSIDSYIKLIVAHKGECQKQTWENHFRNPSAVSGDYFPSMPLWNTLLLL